MENTICSIITESTRNEKQKIQYLNERLEGYIETVRELESEKKKLSSELEACYAEKSKFQEKINDFMEKFAKEKKSVEEK